MVIHKIHFVLFLCCISSLASALTAEDLKERISEGSNLTIIDIRSTFQYRKAHVENAINIPSPLLCKKNIPFSGDVVVYGDGIEVGVSEQSISCLKDRVQSSLYLLDGGYPAWAALSSGVGSKIGLSISQDRFIGYQGLKKLSQSNRPPVLIDIRQGHERESLSDHFPSSVILTSQVNVSLDFQDVISQSVKYKSELLVIVGDNVELSNDFANKLHAAGIKRVARLVGGEHSLKTRGSSDQETTQAL